MKSATKHRKEVSSTNLNSERLVLAADDDEAPGLVAGPVDAHLLDLLRHLGSLSTQELEEENSTRKITQTFFSGKRSTLFFRPTRKLRRTISNVQLN